jgi:hypothetical protein
VWIVLISDNVRENMLRKSLESLMNTQGGVASDRDCRTLASTSGRLSVLLACLLDFADLGVEG